MLNMYAIFAIVVVFLIFLRFSFWRQKCCQRLPGKPPSFFNVFGDVTEFMLSKDIHIDVMSVVRKRIELFKKEKLICAWITYVPFVILVKAEAVKDLLKGNKMNEKSWVYGFVEPALGKGLITSSAAKAKFRRKLLTPCFHPNILRKYFKVFIEESEKLVDVLVEETNKEFTCIENFITLCSLDVIIKTMFGCTINALGSRSFMFKTALERGEEIFFSRIYKPWLWPSFIFWNSKYGKEMKQHLNLLEQLTDKVIQEKKEKHLRGEIETDSQKYKALLDLLLEKHLETQELNEEDIKEEVKTFTLAGHETVATSVSWALYLIGLHPDIQAKIHEEIDQVFGEDVKRSLTETDLSGLQYLDRVLKESARLYTAVPVIARQANEDTNICGYAVPKGTTCVILLYFLHRDEDVFPEPNKFDPDRFLPENTANIPEYGYIPFSAGTRNCIGYKFAEIEIKTIICSILRSFTIESLDEMDKIQPTMKAVLHPSKRIRLRIRSRSIQKHC